MGSVDLDLDGLARAVVVGRAVEVGRPARVHLGVASPGGDQRVVRSRLHDTAAAEAATMLPEGRLRVEVGPRGRPGTTVRVTVRYRSATAVPLVGRFLDDVGLEATASMRVER